LEELGYGGDTDWLPPRLVPEIVFVAEQQALEEISGLDRSEESDEAGIRYFNMGAEGFEITEESKLLDSGDVTSELWTGRLRGAGERVGGAHTDNPAEFSFVLERHGSPDLIVLRAAILLILYLDHRASQASKECFDWAIKACEDRGIGYFRVRRRLPGLLRGGSAHDCEFYCRGEEPPLPWWRKVFG